MTEALNAFIETHELKSGLDKVNASNAWKTVMGNPVNRYTTETSLNRDTLYVQLSSSALREELIYRKDEIIALLNEELGRLIIKKLILR